MTDSNSLIKEPHHPFVTKATTGIGAYLSSIRLFGIRNQMHLTNAVRKISELKIVIMISFSEKDKIFLVTRKAAKPHIAKNNSPSMKSCSNSS